MKVNKKQLTEEVKTAGLFMVGMIGGAQVSRMLQKRQGVGELLDGLDGVSKSMVAPAITAAAGAAMGALLPKKELRTVGFGMAAMGSALAANAMGAKVLPLPAAPALPAPGAKADVKGLGYLMDELPDPSVLGLDGEPSFVDADGNMFDAAGNPVNGLGAYRDSEGNLYDDAGNPINGPDDGVYDPEGNLLMGYTAGEGTVTGDGSIPGIGDVDFDLDEPMDGVGDFDDEYGMLTGPAGTPAYDLEL